MICSVCNKEFEEQHFDSAQNKCILHSEKISAIASPRTFNQLFQQYIKENTTAERIWIQNIHFPLFYEIYDSMFSYYKINFIDCTFNGNNIQPNENQELYFAVCNFKFQFAHPKNSKLMQYLACKFDEYKIEQQQFGEKRIIDNLNFCDCDFGTLKCHHIHFKKELFHYSNKEFPKINYEITYMTLTHCEFDENLILLPVHNHTFKIDELNLSESTFRGKVKIQFCEIKDANFYNTKFEDLADFYQSKFEKVNFERTDFKGISVFSETEFNCNVDFKYTKFLGKALFRDTVITGILNLRNSIFDDEANFLDITSQKREKNKDNEFIGEIKSIQVANRETARVIKNFYDGSNNIIEANKFYALEMAEREKELDKNLTKNWKEWLIFKAHKISSNHSQDWLLPILWMFVSTFIFVILRQNTYCQNDMIFWSLTTIVILWISAFIFIEITKLSLKWFLGILAISIPVFLQATFKDFSTLINPFSTMTGKDEFTFSLLVYKIIIAYLVYQLIISIRQNTKRK